MKYINVHINRSFKRIQKDREEKPWSGSTFNDFQQMYYLSVSECSFLAYLLSGIKLLSQINFWTFQRMTVNIITHSDMKVWRNVSFYTTVVPPVSFHQFSILIFCSLLLTLYNLIVSLHTTPLSQKTLHPSITPFTPYHEHKKVKDIQCTCQQYYVHNLQKFLTHKYWSSIVTYNYCKFNFWWTFYRNRTASKWINVYYTSNFSSQFRFIL